MKIPTLAPFIVTSTLALFVSAGWGQSADTDTRKPAAAASASVPADNTKSNRENPSNRDRTADDQKNNMSDEKITQQIRRNVMADKSLSTYAHNAKIVSVNGTVTLNGVVHSEAERSHVAQIAAEVAGKANVVNDIKVEPK
ncbi:MAG: BON domain-containing protein [Gammaproteobacteria bacterium]|nr:BON domain-containing protein [Gammaproteobacteria bacterium]